MVQFQEDNPGFRAGLLSFTLEYILVSMWPNNSLMSDYNTCDKSCTPGQTEKCGCTCETDIDDWSDDEVNGTLWLYARFEEGKSTLFQKKG